MQMSEEKEDWQFNPETFILSSSSLALNKFSWMEIVGYGQMKRKCEQNMANQVLGPENISML